ncbi:exopolyphosphatase [uncultured Actinomyces sp.]|uniref:Ppx/GppA phosphatase family protein n=1 Tax=uncultured Actinomyces sp. TaxID=249061 RepID=UPI00288AAFA3|nr:exopolyphosphatase [uncultured Actinomyces sp.]
MTRVAAIDCGTNTIRLLVADARVSPGGAVRLVPLVRLNEIVRLGQGVDRTGRLDEAALERTLAVVADYAGRCRELGAQSVRFVATSATRDASNRAVFVEGVRELLGVEPEVVSGQEEARLSFAGSLLGADGEGAFPAADAGPGVAAGPDTGSDAGVAAGSAGARPDADARPDAAVGMRRLVTDLGGGSTELVLGVDAPAAAYSMNTGSVRVTERYLADGVTPAAEAAARDHVRALLDRAGAVVDLGATRELVGLAGTITTVTAHALGLESFEPEAIDGARLDVGTALASCEAIVHSTAAERESWGYLRPGRRDVIAAGALVWSEVIARVVEDTAARGHRLAHTVTSLHDILDGIALSLVRPAGDPVVDAR